MKFIIFISISLFLSSQAQALSCKFQLKETGQSFTVQGANLISVRKKAGEICIDKLFDHKMTNSKNKELTPNEEKDLFDQCLNVDLSGC